MSFGACFVSNFIVSGRPHPRQDVPHQKQCSRLKVFPYVCPSTVDRYVWIPLFNKTCGFRTNSTKCVFVLPLGVTWHAKWAPDLLGRRIGSLIFIPLHLCVWTLGELSAFQICLSFDILGLQKSRDNTKILQRKTSAELQSASVKCIVLFRLPIMHSTSVTCRYQFVDLSLNSKRIHNLNSTSWPRSGSLYRKEWVELTPNMKITKLSGLLLLTRKNPPRSVKWFGKTYIHKFLFVQVKSECAGRGGWLHAFWFALY